MNNQNVILEAEKILPMSILYGTMSYKGTPYIVKDFMEKIIPETLNPTATPVTLSSFINKNISPYVKRNERAQALDEFIKNTHDFQPEIKIGPNDYLDVKEYLIENIMPYMESATTAIFAGKKKSLYEIYEAILNNTYTEPSLVDYAEICSSFCETIDQDVLKSTYNGMVFEEYVKSVLPLMMTSVSKIQDNGINYDIDLYVENLVRLQTENLSYQNDTIDRTNENPGLIDEIKIAIDDDNDSLTQSERNAIIEHNNYIGNEILNVDHQLTLVNNAIDKCTNEVTLTSLQNELAKIEAKAKEEDKTFIAILKYRIDEKMRSIIKTSNNREDLITSTLRYIETIKSKINAASTTNDISTVLGLISILSNKIQSLGIEDRTISNEILKLKELYKYKMQVIRENEIVLGNANEATVKINNEFEIIRRTMDFLDETDDIFYNSVLTSLNYKIEDLRGVIIDAKSNNLVSNYDSERYETMLNDIINELDKKNKNVGIVR